MSEVHQKIVDEIVKGYSKKPEVIAINVLGSLATGTERLDSDVDIEIVVDTDGEWGWEKRNKYGIHIDFVICPKKQMEHQVRDYPFLSHINLHKKILYDPQNFMKGMQKELQEYMDKHPEVVKFWEEKLKIMKENKAKGKDPHDAKKTFDEAEILFSKEHKITRDYFRSDE